MVTLTAEEFEVLTPEQRVAHFASEEKIVFGQDVAHDRKGNPIEKGIGSPGRETINHFRGILKAEGQEAHDRAVAELWKRDPGHAERLNLPKPRGRS